MNEKNVLVSLTIDEAKYLVNELEYSLDEIAKEEVKPVVKILSKFYDSMEYAERN